jgi:hypothetical protein
LFFTQRKRKRKGKGKGKGLKESFTNDSEGVMFGPSNNTKKNIIM